MSSAGGGSSRQELVAQGFEGLLRRVARLCTLAGLSQCRGKEHSACAMRQRPVRQSGPFIWDLCTAFASLNQLLNLLGHLRELTRGAPRTLF